MFNNLKNHSEKTLESIAKLKKMRKNILSLGSNVMQADNRNFYPLDFIIIGALKRCLSTTRAIEILVLEWNLTCARAILRIQLDTALRLSAYWLSPDPQKMASDVMAGKPVNRMKDKDECKMQDSYLVKKLGEKYEWVPQVYKNTSGYIHFSEQHVFNSIYTFNDQKSKIEIEISDTDYKFPESSWIEIIDCATECLDIIGHYLKGYKLTKNYLDS